ncbi:MAG: hypothetical protein DI539_26370 [Flavobacterium psychrophilum]|nr:MAG: hypothetical protein DI539_26370 [Flavobacterium psychrophilum]
MMAMTDKERLELRIFCSFILKEYGIEFNTHDPVLPSIYVIHKEMQKCIDANKLIANKIDQASARINPKVFHFNHSGEAWKFQMGIAMKWLLSVGLVLVAIALGVWCWSISNDVARARIVSATYDNLSKMATFAKKNKEGSYFIDITETRADSVRHFEEYVRIDKNTIRIFLGRD